MSEKSGKEALKAKGVAAATTIASGLAVFAIGAGLFHEKGLGLDPLGEPRKTVSEKEAAQRALDDYRTAFRKANPYGKFALQYTEVTDVAIDYREGGSGRGILGFTSSFDTDTTYDNLVEIYNNCLDQTPYDRGAAIVRNLQDNPDQLTVNPPDHSNKESLTFKGVITEDRLIPADNRTEEVVETYGCDPVEENIFISQLRSDTVESSPVILETR